MMDLISFGETLVFLALLVASITALAVGIERWMVFKRNSSKKSSDFMNEFLVILRTHNLEAAAAFVNNNPAGIYSDFAGFAINHYSQGHDGLSNLLQGRIVEKRMFLEKRLVVLNTLGNNAPFIGLLGTVLGVIQAFNGLGTLGSTGAEVVMRSISSALVATAAGLFVAIPVVMANNFFSRKIKIILQNLEVISMEFMASYTHKKTRMTKKELCHGNESDE